MSNGRKQSLDELVEIAHDAIGIANATGDIEVADPYGYHISEDTERAIVRIILEVPEIKEILAQGGMNA